MITIPFPLAAAIVGAVVITAFVAVGSFGRRMERRRRAGGAIDAISSAVMCGLCRDAGFGRCTCSVRCGHRLCHGRRPLATWNEDDIDVLEGRRLP